MDTTLDDLKKINIVDGTVTNKSSPFYAGWKAGIKTQDDLDYAFKLQNAMANMSNVDVRVETPWVTVYTNSMADLNKLINLDQEKVKYISLPPDNTTLSEDTIIMPKMDYEFRITLGKTTQEHSAFISWAENNKKCKLTKSCIKDLSKPRSWGGTHFYLTGDNNILMAKMHLGGSIAKIERIIKA
jgi:hypothetical protein